MSIFGAPVFVLLQYYVPLHLAGIGRGFKPYALTLGVAAAAGRQKSSTAPRYGRAGNRLAAAARCALALCTKSGGGGRAFRPQKTLSCANFEYLSAFARAERKKSHSPERYSKALFHLFSRFKRRRLKTYVMSWEKVWTRKHTSQAYVKSPNLNLKTHMVW